MGPVRACCYRSGSADAARSRATDPAMTRAYPAAIRGLLITGMFSTFFIGALYFEHVLGYSPVKTGLAFLPQALVMAALSTGITAKLVDHAGSVLAASSISAPTRPG